MLDASESIVEVVVAKNGDLASIVEVRRKGVMFLPQSLSLIVG
jgi:hypothetical protein